MPLNARLFLVASAVTAIIASVPASAQNGREWTFHRSTDAATGRETSSLVFGITETDATIFSADCQAGSQDTKISLSLHADYGELGDRSEVKVSISAGNFGARYTGQVRAPASQDAPAGVRLRIDETDPLWQALITNDFMAFQIALRPPVGMGLRGSGKATRDFLQACKSYSSDRPGRMAGTGGGSSAAPGSETRVAVPPPPADPVKLTVEAGVIPVGKWPEGLAHDGRSLWVAESGNRRIAQVDPTRLRVTRRVSVGRLPVGMLALADGRILSLVHTDKKLWQQNPSGRKGGTLARIADCPWGLAGDTTSIWVLTYTNCSSAGSKVFEIDPKSGRTRRRFDLPGGSFDITAGPNGVFVIHTHGQNSTLSGIKPSTGQVVRHELPGARLHHIQAVDTRLFGAGALEGGGVVASFSPPLGQTKVPEAVSALAATGDHVVAVGDRGTIYVLAAPGLTLLRQFDTTFGAFRPQSVLPVGDRLFISTHRGNGQNGSVLIVDGWRP